MKPLCWIARVRMGGLSDIRHVWFSSFFAVLFSVVCGLHAAELPAVPFLNLKSEDFRTRETAQAELLAWARKQPEVATQELLRQSSAAEDPETRERCLAVLRDLVGDEYLKEGEGYIGIRMQDEVAMIPGSTNPSAVIRVMQVVPDSAAQRAGLQVNDLIASLNDQGWNGGVASVPFGAKIRQMKPNTEVRLKVFREGKLVDINVKLGRRPLNADNPFLDDRQMDLEAAERAAKEAYFRRWLDERKAKN